MKLKSIRFSGLYSYGSETTLNFSEDMTLIVGPNNAGKSNIFRVIRSVIDTLTGKNRGDLQETEIFRSSTTPLIEVRVHLSPEETELLVDYLSFYSFYNESNNAIARHYKFKNKPLLTEKLNDLTIGISWDSYHISSGERSPSDFILTFDKLGLKLYTKYAYSDLLIKGIKENKNAQLEFRQFLDTIGEYKDGENPYLRRGENNPVVVSGFSHNSIDVGELDGRDKAGVRKVLSSAGKKYLNSNNYLHPIPFIGSIFENAYHISSDKRILTRQEEFDNRPMISETVVGIPDHLEYDGSNLAFFLYGLMHSLDMEKRERFTKIQTAFNELMKSQNLSFDIVLRSTEKSVTLQKGSDNINKEPVALSSITLTTNHPAIVIHTKGEKNQIFLEQASSGLGEAVFLLTLSYGLKDRVVLLDEPASNLHPPLMKALLSNIIGRNQDGSSAGNQFIITTHSPELTHFALFEGNACLYYIRKGIDGSSIAKSMNPETQKWFTEKKQALSYQLDTRLFFGKRVILAEGESDKGTLIGLAEYFESKGERLGLDNNDIIIVAVDGKPNFPKYRKLLGAFEIPYCILADYDVKEENENINLKEIFESCSFVTKDGIEGDMDGVFVIKNKDLEHFLNELNPKVFSQVRDELVKTYGYNLPKPVVAKAFLERMINNDQQSLTALKELLVRVSKS